MMKPPCQVRHVGWAARTTFGTSRIAAAFLVLATPVLAQTKPTIAQFLAPAMPMELVSAKNADRIAWLSYDQGVRNVYAAAAPDFKPVQITRFKGDDGVTLTSLQISDDGW